MLLRATSGFAADVPSTVGNEERERRLRWKTPFPRAEEGRAEGSTV
jgi:hypothetical protein